MGSPKEQKLSNCPEAIDHSRFLKMLTHEFPEVPQAFDNYSKGLLHCEMGVLARLTEEAIDQGRFWQVEKYFCFVERVRENATPEVENAIKVSFIDYLAFGEVADKCVQALKRMPKILKAILVEIDGRGSRRRKS